MENNEYGFADAGEADEVETPAPKATRKRAAKASDEPPAKMSLLDQIRKDAKRSLSRIVTYEVPTRPGYKVAFDVNIEKDDVELWTRNAQGRNRSADKLNTLNLAAQVILESCHAILVGDQVVDDGDGGNMMLDSAEWVAIYDDGGDSAIVALRAFMGDGVVQSLGLAVLREAGYGDGTELNAEDGLPNPTKA